ncbi:MAG: hypothetical protein ABIR79_24010, partial [Candidatus Binatia bacterium]
MVRLDGAIYSVPSRWAGLDLVVRTGATTVTIVGRDGTPIVHPRRWVKAALATLAAIAALTRPASSRWRRQLSERRSRVTNECTLRPWATRIPARDERF